MARIWGLVLLRHFSGRQHKILGQGQNIDKHGHLVDNHPEKMVRIRLRRMGRRNRPFYRVVVADGRSPRDGKFIELIGHYNPLTDPETVSIDEEKALKWLRCGAQPTDTVRTLLNKLGIIDKVKPTSGQN
jgi:small subunit ribosomal protein S16